MAEPLDAGKVGANRRNLLPQAVAEELVHQVGNLANGRLAQSVPIVLHEVLVAASAAMSSGVLSMTTHLARPGRARAIRGP